MTDNEHNLSTIKAHSQMGKNDTADGIAQPISVDDNDDRTVTNISAEVAISSVKRRHYQRKRREEIVDHHNSSFLINKELKIPTPPPLSTLRATIKSEFDEKEKAVSPVNQLFLFHFG
uniref:Uncharacterized protein n=1 Tax=Setaria digitata TaxID=48799 RepID=A0A915PS76_9BILA